MNTKHRVRELALSLSPSHYYFFVVFVSIPHIQQENCTKYTLSLRKHQFSIFVSFNKTQPVSMVNWLYGLHLILTFSFWLHINDLIVAVIYFQFCFVLRFS